MSVSTVSSPSAIAPAPTPAPAGAATTAADLQDRFLKLLVTQLNNQDPLNPMDNSQLTSQLAQMSTVSGIETLNTAVQTLVSQSGASQTLQASSLIGRSVLAPGSDMSGGGASSAFAVDLPSSAQSVKVAVVDAAGNTVRTIDMGTLPSGLHSAIWDGNNDAGQAMAAGVYGLQVTATNGTASVPAQSLVYSQVGSVTQATGGGVTLDLNSGASISLADVRKVL